MRETYPFKSFEMAGGWRFVVQYQLGTDQFSLAVKYGDRFVLPVGFTEKAKVGQIPQTSYFINPMDGWKAAQEDGLTPPDAESFLRAALNTAWEIGLRPDGYEDTRESLKHINSHLQDMRTLAFAASKLSKP